MSIRRSPRKILSSAFHPTALTRMPIASPTHSLGSCTPQRRLSASSRPDTSRGSIMAVAFIVVIDAPDLSPSVQIPIAHRTF
jgi:hypothetical protein